jgi:predicted DNA-binding antitoxin AbrB/MazE fold protein
VLSKIVKVRYEKGILKPLEPVDLQEGEERIAILVPVDEVRRRIPKKYRGILGKASEEEIEELIAEAEWETL